MKTISISLRRISLCCLFLSIISVGLLAQNYTVNSIPYNPTSFTSGTSILLNDDQFSPVIPLGFGFCFYGTYYPAVVIGANGVISFNVSDANGYCQWPIGTLIPSSSLPMNCIMVPMQDMYIPAGGVIRYETLGMAPNRVFTVSYDSVDMFSCTSLTLSSQVKLYEGLNIIEIFIREKNICAGWNGGAAIEGIQNASGTSANCVPGRNYPTQWSATNDGK